MIILRRGWIIYINCSLLEILWTKPSSGDWTLWGFYFFNFLSFYTCWLTSPILWSFYCSGCLNSRLLFMQTLNYTVNFAIKSWTVQVVLGYKWCCSLMLYYWSNVLNNLKFLRLETSTNHWKLALCKSIFFTLPSVTVNSEICLV